MRFTIKPLVLAYAATLCVASLGIHRAVRRSAGWHPVSGARLITPGQDGKATLLHSGWRISPAGQSIKTGDMLLGSAFSPDGSTLAVTHCGYGAHGLLLVDPATKEIRQRIPLARAWNGIAWSQDGSKIYVSGAISTGAADIHVLERSASGEFKVSDPIILAATQKDKILMAGLALSRDGSILYAINHLDGHLYGVDTATRGTVSKTEVGSFPIACKLAADGNTLYVANLGGSEVSAVDVRNPLSVSVDHRMETGAHPNDLCLSRDGRAFVSCGNSDVVTVLDLEKKAAIETLKTSLTPKSALGSTPNSVSLAPDQRTLYVANADANNLAVIDVSRPGRSRVTGFIPTGWYPTLVTCLPNGPGIIIGSGKGQGTGPNMAELPIPKERTGGFLHIGRQLNGSLSFLAPPDREQLEVFTKQVVANTPYSDKLLASAPYPEKTAIPTRVGGKSPIKYVVYIIKENRTYDQVFGDIPQGNGDPRLTLFGEEITPNHHALAREFVLLDNLYCNGEVSADGHPWSTSAYATEMTQRAWVMSYSGKGARPYDELTNNPGAGFIWEACLRKGHRIRSYGEYANHSSLKGLVCEEWTGKRQPGEIARGRDMMKADIFIRELQEFTKTGKMPRFTIMSLGEDHTDGTKVGAHTPKACVASNDYGLGKIVEAVTKSPIWKETAIFVIEDDAQNGPDHVDAHRTIGLVISPYTRRRTVDSTMYTTTSMLRTMELILGVAPLTQHDAGATPMFACFSRSADATPYSALPPRIDVNARNLATAYGAAESAKMDFSEYDRIDEQALNRILWHSIKGKQAAMPPLVRRAVISGGRVLGANSVDEDDD